MYMLKKLMAVLWMIFFFTGASDAFANWCLDLETGAVFCGYNDVQVPGESGTRFSLTEDLKTDPNYFFRIRLSYSITDRHHLSALAAPLRLDASGQVDRLIRFNEEKFSADTPLNARYRFDSYRLTYRYDVYFKEKLKVGLGFTAKIRDASISLEYKDTKTEKKNTGFVPLLNFRVDWTLSKRLGLLLEGDALAAPQGRAEDVLLAFRYRLTEDESLKLGYRMLEGGVDVFEVYNFTLIHYIVAGFIVTF
jgi:hypothetical protein